MRRYGQVVVAVANTTAATYRTRRAKPSSSVGDLNVGTVEPAYSQTRRLISRPVQVQLHARASSSHEPITSSQKSTKRPVMFAPPGERHRDCCTADTRSCRTVGLLQCSQLVSTFCQFFVYKVRRIRDISAALQSSVHRTFAIRQHLGPQLSSFEPVTAEEVRACRPSRHHLTSCRVRY